MGQESSKEALLDTIRVKHRQLERYLFAFQKDSHGAFVATDRPKFGREEMLQPGVVGEWSLKDVLVHLIDWETRFIRCYEVGLRGRGSEKRWVRFRWEEIDTLDLEIPPELRERPLEGVLADLPRSYQRILATVRSVSEGALFSDGYHAWTGEATLADLLAMSTYEHYDWAKGKIRRWRRMHAGEYLNKKVVLERTRGERQRLERRLSELTRDRMVEGGVVGEWSVKDVLAHLVDWEQRFIGWYEAGLRGENPETPAPGLTWGDMDVLNRQIYETHRDEDLDDVMSAFHRSYERVTAVVLGMPEEEMFEVGRYAWLGEGNLVSYILANTANHYRWANAQIHAWAKAQGL